MPFTQHNASLAELKALFHSLPQPAATQRHGFFRARFIGPTWIRLPGPLIVALAERFAARFPLNPATETVSGRQEVSA